MSGPHLIGVDVDHFVMRLLTDCLNESTSTYWIKRAEQFEAARPVPGEFHGQATTAELSRRWQELTEIATACRHRAAIAPLDDIAPEVEAVWNEVA